MWELYLHDPFEGTYMGDADIATRPIPGTVIATIDGISITVGEIVGIDENAKTAKIVVGYRD